MAYLTVSWKNYELLCNTQSQSKLKESEVTPIFYRFQKMKISRLTKKQNMYLNHFKILNLLISLENSILYYFILKPSRLTLTQDSFSKKVFNTYQSNTYSKNQIKRDRSAFMKQNADLQDSISQPQSNATPLPSP